jgi:phage terminase small subunit
LYPHVVAEVQRPLKEKRAACAAEARRLVAEVAKIAFADPRQLLDERGAIRGLHELPDDAAAAIARMEVICTEEGSGAEAVRVRRVFVRFTASRRPSG